jgi:hypothetical protein
MLKRAALIPLSLAAVFTAGFALRHFVVALFNDPKDLPALESDARVHFQKQAEDCARQVAALLPKAVARVEAEQARPFARQPIIGVYASFDDYARANGFENPAIAATSRSGRVILSPTLCGADRDRLAGVLTHELSHSHLFGWRSSLFSARPPSWFTEGLAVMVSDGGGAEGTSDADAIAALRQGYAILVADTGLWRDFASIRFEAEPPHAGKDFLAARQRLAYREAGLFVAWLRQEEPKGFVALLQRLEDGAAFGDAFRRSYVTSASERWREFLAALARAPPSD